MTRRARILLCVALFFVVVYPLVLYLVMQAITAYVELTTR